jgi:DUF1365 family protein
VILAERHAAPRVTPRGASCLYEGALHHRRSDPPYDFTHRLALAYLDLEELPHLLGGRLQASHPGIVRFRRAGYLGDPRQPLGESVRELVERETGWRPRGPVRILTQLRVLGYAFNPVSFYYCLSVDGQSIEALVAEVTNTPWGERHPYVITGGSGAFKKAMHVSPFMGMDHTYACHAEVPGRRLSVRIENWREGEKVFQAGLALERRELNSATLRRALIRYPLPGARVLAQIYGHALALRLAGAPTFRHPRSAGS